MPSRQYTKQRLVDGTNADMRQECLAPIIGYPGGTCGGTLILITLCFYSEREEVESVNAEFSTRLPCANTSDGLLPSAKSFS